MLERIVVALVRFVAWGNPALLTPLLWVILRREKKERQAELQRMRECERAHQAKHFKAGVKVAA